MRIDEYFSQPLSDIYDRNGVETDWLDIGTIEITSGRMSVGDNAFFPGDQLEIDIKLGQYSVQAKARDFGTDRRVSRLRAFTQQPPFLSRLRGQIAVGFNSVSICDPVAFLAALQKHTDGGRSWELVKSVYWNRLEEDFGTISLFDEPPATMAFVHCGWGSGHYDVFELISNATLVGLEAIFIEPEEPYIFENVKEFDII